MSMPIVTGGASAAALGTSATLAATAHALNHDFALLLPAAISAVAAAGGFVVAGVSYWRHRNDASDLALHEVNDNSRFDYLEQLVGTVYVHIIGETPPSRDKQAG